MMNTNLFLCQTVQSATLEATHVYLNLTSKEEHSNTTYHEVWEVDGGGVGT